MEFIENVLKIVDPIIEDQISEDWQAEWLKSECEWPPVESGDRESEWADDEETTGMFRNQF
jgi:hypothetical protein